MIGGLRRESNESFLLLLKLDYRYLKDIFTKNLVTNDNIYLTVISTYEAECDLNTYTDQGEESGGVLASAITINLRGLCLRILFFRIHHKTLCLPF